MNMKFLHRLFILVFGTMCLVAWTNPMMEEAETDYSLLDAHEEAIRQRLPSIVTIVSPVYTPAVKSYLNTYIVRRPDHTSEMLGWAAVYFPIFEKALEAEGLPKDLKYLSIVESALNPSAISRSGAGGLWQFMKPTARECGLKISSYVDERMDPEKSSAAAAKYLKQLYKTFGDWELVMAAYNAGPGRIRSAIKRAGTTDYWKLCKYLPAETRSYVPGFIAASYLMNYHQEHNLSPVFPELAMGELTTVFIHEGMSMTEIAKRSGLTVDEVRRLNPAYVRNYIPSSHTGFPVVLPATSAELFNSNRLMEVPALESLAATESSTVTRNGVNYKVVTKKTMYVVKTGDNLYSLARRNNCSVSDLMRWNNLHDSRLAIGQRLEIRQVSYEPIIEEALAEVLAPHTMRKVEVLVAIPALHMAYSKGIDAPEVDFNVQPTVKPQPGQTLVLMRRQSVRQALMLQHGSATGLHQFAEHGDASTGEIVYLNK